MPDLTEYRTHELKILPEYFKEVANESKRFEVRKNDRDYKSGDFLHLKEWNPLKGEYTGQEAICAVRYILQDEKYLQPGFCVMTIVVLKTRLFRFPGKPPAWTGIDPEEYLVRS